MVVRSSVPTMLLYWTGQYTVLPGFIAELFPVRENIEHLCDLGVAKIS